MQLPKRCHNDVDSEYLFHKGHLVKPTPQLGGLNSNDSVGDGDHVHARGTSVQVPPTSSSSSGQAVVMQWVLYFLLSPAAQTCNIESHAFILFLLGTKREASERTNVQASGCSIPCINLQ